MDNQKVEETVDEKVEEAVEEKVEELLDDMETKPSTWRKVQSIIVMFAALMISAGQWNDTKELFSSLYEDILANFTNEFEYELLAKINVGNSLSYVTDLVGEPQILKRSKLDESVSFYYFTDEKYDLTLFVKDERVVGYGVLVKQDSFSPDIPFSEALGSKSLIETSNNVPQYTFDSSNLVYFNEAQELGKQQMFLTLVRGYIEYGERSQPDNMPDSFKEDLLGMINDLVEAETYGESDESMDSALTSIRQFVYPNFFAITELKSNFVADALLTRYEYQMFTRS